MPKKTNPSTVKKSRAKNKKTGADFFIVGLGGSAGGLAAFIELLENIPADTGLAFVVVQHLLADAKSSLSDILSGRTKLPVKEVARNTPIIPGHVYVIPSHKNIILNNNKLQLSERKQAGPNLSIDEFFVSLAKGKKQNAIGVILSGTGTDGTLGMKAIREAGGITFAQDQDAAFGAMPGSVVAAGLADYVFSPAKIAKKLLAISASPALYFTDSARGLTCDISRSEERAYQKILNLILNSSEVDFTYYKPGTLKRRIKRRMDIKNIRNFSEYAEYLQQSPKELAALYHDMLIKVTNFFRDQSLFDFLQSAIFPEIFKRPPATFRIWVPGCSTGEEVYSLAITLAEYMAKNKINIPAQIFGTDISDNALDIARHGRYPLNIETGISTEILSKYFKKNEDGYEVSAIIRTMCVFAKHNMVKDVPFTKMDIVSCRNVLIYLDSILQKRAFPIFHYALKPYGFLILGTAETAASFNDLFSNINKNQKVYSKKAGAFTPRLDFSTPYPPQPQLQSVPNGEVKSIETQADKIVLSRHAPAGVILNNDLSIIQFRGDVGPYLKHPAGRASLDIIKMARKPLLAKILEMINEAKKTGTTIKCAQAGMKVNIEVIPLVDQLSPEKHFLILFEKTKHFPRSAEARPADNDLVTEAEEELAASINQLQSLLETRDTANEELRSANEEVMSANEELQSTNEELETTKEELQSTNEELMILNAELRDRNLDLKKIERSHNKMVPEFNFRTDELQRKDEFISVLGHELRNPLAPIIYSVELANLHGIKDPEIKKLIDVIKRQANQLNNLTNVLLDSARIQRGKIELMPEIVNFSDIIKHAVDTVRVFINERKHKLTVVLPKKPINLRLDPLRVEQIIVNLLNNAAKYTPVGGEIGVEVTDEDGYAVLIVRDNGIGITGDMLPKIFDFFSQADQPLSDYKGGLGVGLMLAKTLTELHDGSLTALSAGLGEGSEFILKLPIAPSRDAGRPEQAAEPGKIKAKKWKILVVDDNIALANLMGQLLHALDQDVIVAYDGASVFDLVKIKKPDLIFVDISMPVMDGYELVRLLREDPALKKTKIMALSSFGAEKRKESLAAGFDVHLIKPLSIGDLENILLQLDTD